MAEMTYFKPEPTLRRIQLCATSFVGQLAYVRQQLPEYKQDIQEVEQTSRLLVRQMVGLYNKARGQMTPEMWRKHSTPRRYMVNPATSPKQP